MTEQNGKSWEGVVIKKNSEHTAAVKVSRLVKHPRYGKYIKKISVYQAHDTMSSKVGEKVRIVEVPKISKTKSKMITEVLK